MNLASKDQLLLKLRRRLRWAAGKGWTEEDFNPRYQEATDDAWGYSNSVAHEDRFSLILEAIPKRVINTALEVGCAEGQFTRHLARRVERLVACDISARAIERARRRNGFLENVEFAQQDIRDGLIVEQADLMVFSDVLYYLAPKEVTGVIKAAVSIMNRGGILVFANEWATHYKNMTSPAETVRLIEQTGGWKTLTSEVRSTGPTSTLMVASFERVAA